MLVPSALAVAALMAAAAADAAPVLEPLRPCYDAVSPAVDGRELITVAGSGFTPNALVDIAVDGEVHYAGVAIDAAGALPAGTVPAPFIASGQRPFAITATEQANPAQTVTVRSRVTRLTVDVRPRRTSPAARVRFRGSGFTAAAPVYAHYLRRGRVRRTVRLVRRPSGPCGDFSVRRRQFPFVPAGGRWTLQVDQRRRYAPDPGSAVFELPIVVSERGA